MPGTGGELQCWGMFLLQSLWQGSGGGFKAPACVNGQQGKAAVHNCSAGAIKIAGSSCHVLSPALSPGKGSKPERATVTGEQCASFLAWQMAPFLCWISSWDSSLGKCSPCSCSGLGVMPDGARFPESQAPLVLILL